MKKKTISPQKLDLTICQSIQQNLVFYNSYFSSYFFYPYFFPSFSRFFFSRFFFRIVFLYFSFVFFLPSCFTLPISPPPMSPPLSPPLDPSSSPYLSPSESLAQPSPKSPTLKEDESGKTKSFSSQEIRPYPITGAWMFARLNSSKWEKLIDRFKQIGGQIIIQNGFPLSYVESQNDLDGLPNLIFHHCQGCLTESFKDFKERLDIPFKPGALTKGTRTLYKNIYLYKNLENFENFPSNCFGLNKVFSSDQYLENILPYQTPKIIEISSKRYRIDVLRTFLPNKIGENCSTKESFSKKILSSDFSLLFIVKIFDTYEQKYLDPLSSLLEVSSQKDMAVYIGAPIFPSFLNQAKLETENLNIENDKIAPASMGLFYNLFNLNLQKWKNQKFSRFPSFKGIYLGFEMNLLSGDDSKTISNPLSFNNQILEAYTNMSRQLKNFFPDKKTLISPYWITNKLENKNFNKKKALAFLKHHLNFLVLNKSIDILAIQDSRGALHTAIYHPFEQDSKVNSLDSVYKNSSYMGKEDPGRTFIRGELKVKDHFGMSSIELFSLSSIILKKKKNHIELWSNIEAFQGYDPSNYFWNPSPKRILDKAISYYDPYVQRHISFAYDDYFTRQEKENNSSLEEKIFNSFPNTIITKASFLIEKNKLKSPVYYIKEPHVILKKSKLSERFVKIKITELHLEAYHFLEIQKKSQLEIHWTFSSGKKDSLLIDLSKAQVSSKNLSSKPGLENITVPLNFHFDVPFSNSQEQPLLFNLKLTSLADKSPLAEPYFFYTDEDLKPLIQEITTKKLDSK